MSSSEEFYAKPKHSTKKIKANNCVSSPLILTKDPKENSPPLERYSDDKLDTEKKSDESVTEKDMGTLCDIPENAIKLIIGFLGVTSLDSTNVCAAYPKLATYRNAVLTDYYAAISSQYKSNRATGFLSPDHCRTPVLSKPEESLYSDVQMLRSHRRLQFDD